MIKVLLQSANTPFICVKNGGYPYIYGVGRDGGILLGKIEPVANARGGTLGAAAS